MYRIRLFCILLFIFFLRYKAQYHSSWYNTENGLPQNSVKSIFKDKFGFIWLSSEDGITRYDGKNFKIYNRSLHLKNYHFHTFSGNIKKDSVFIYNENEQNLLLINKRNITELPNSKKNKYYRRSITENGKSYIEFSKSNYLNRIYGDQNFFLKLKSGVYFFNKNETIYKDLKGDKKVISLVVGRKQIINGFVHNDILFFSDKENNRIVKIDHGKLSIIQAPSLYTDSKSTVLWDQITDQVFIINKNNIFKSNYNNGRLELQKILSAEEIDPASISSVYFDETYNRLYLGDNSRGLQIIDFNQFHTIKNNTPFSENIFYSLLPYTDNSVISHDGNIFSKNKTSRVSLFNERLQSRYLSYNKKGDIIGLNAFQYRKLLKEYNFKKADKSFLADYIEWIGQSRDLYMCVIADSKNQHQVLIFNDDQFTVPQKKYNFSFNVNIITHFDPENLLIGTIKGLYLVSLKTDKIRLIGSNSYGIKNIVKNSKGDFWITTQGNGFYLLKDKKLWKLPEDKDGYLSNAHCILTDDKSFLWISTNHGLFRVSEKELYDYVTHQKKIFYYKYLKQDGFFTNEFNGGCFPCGLKLNNGELVFPSMDGLVFFTPEKIKSYYPNPNTIFLERGTIDNSEIQIESFLKLPIDYKEAQVFIDVPYYGNSNNLHIESLFSGNKKSNWESIENNIFTIGKLPAGDYLLKIRVLVSPNGKFAYKNLKIKVEAKFYETLFFRILIVIVCIIIIFLIINIRTKALTSKNKSLEQIVSEKDGKLKETSENLEKAQEIIKNETEYQKKIIATISHDITTPIKYLSNLSKNLYETDDIELQKKYFDSIYKSSEELYKFTLSLKEYSNLYREDKRYEEKQYVIDEVIEEKVNLFKEIAVQNHVKIINEADKGITTNINKNILAIIIHNLLDNAVKNTFKGKIMVAASESEGFVVIRISDSGVGMSEEQIHYYQDLFEKSDINEHPLKKQGLGLHMVFHFIKKIQGAISFRKNIPTGTIVEIKIKL